MHRAIHQYRHDIMAQRTWCRLECGHSVLCHDDVQQDLHLGHLVRCLRCSHVSIIRLQVRTLYELFLREEPSEPLLAVFDGYDFHRAVTHWNTKRFGKIIVRLSEIAAVELV